jgi:hypothetical protein
MKFVKECVFTEDKPIGEERDATLVGVIIDTPENFIASPKQSQRMEPKLFSCGSRFPDVSKNIPFTNLYPQR